MGRGASRQDSPSASASAPLNSQCRAGGQIDPQATTAQQQLPASGRGQRLGSEPGRGDRIPLSVDATDEREGEKAKVSHGCVSLVVRTTQGIEIVATLHRSPCLHRYHEHGRACNQISRHHSACSAWVYLCRTSRQDTTRVLLGLHPIIRDTMEIGSRNKRDRLTWQPTDMQGSQPLTKT